MKLSIEKTQCALQLLSSYRKFVDKMNTHWNGETELHGYTHIHEFMQFPLETLEVYLSDVEDDSEKYYPYCELDLLLMKVIAEQIAY